MGMEKIATIKPGILLKKPHINQMKLKVNLRIHFLLLMLMGLSACASPTPQPLPSPTPNSTPKVAVTAWTALIEGQLVLVDGCLQVVEAVSQKAYTLVFPPDYAVSISGDTVKVTSGLIAGEQREDVLQIGATAQFGGGETIMVDEELRKTIPSDCQGWYWVFGGFPKVKATPAP